MAYAHVLARFAPDNALRVLAVDAERATFVMERAPQGSTVWKDELLDGHVDPAVAVELGRLLGTIHRRARSTTVRATFADRTAFEALRIEPYLHRTIARHPSLKPQLTEVVARLGEPGTALVHGDFSPKNVLVSPGRRVLLLDHEVAHWGDPAFDVAFLLTHLALKTVVRPDCAIDLSRAAQAFLGAYRDCAAAAIDIDAAIRRAGVISAALLLARVDGRSPVDYLDDEGRTRVRSLAGSLLRDPLPADRMLDRVLGDRT